MESTLIFLALVSSSNREDLRFGGGGHWKVWVVMGEAVGREEVL
jgi:hypothetical protein